MELRKKYLDALSESQRKILNKHFPDQDLTNPETFTGKVHYPKEFEEVMTLQFQVDMRRGIRIFAYDHRGYYMEWSEIEKKFVRPKKDNSNESLK